MTESDVVKTYIFAGYIVRLGESPIIVWHIAAREDGAARGLRIDEDNLLWTSVNGSYKYRKIGPDGFPDAGRDSLGRGEVSTTYSLFLPETTDDIPNTLKINRAVDITFADIDADAKIQVYSLRDGAAASQVGTDITSGSAASRYFSTSNTSRRDRVQIDIVTSASYAPASRDPKIFYASRHAHALPERADGIRFIVNTGLRLSSGALPNEDAHLMRTNLQALVNTLVSLTEPNGITTLNVIVIDVGDLELREDENENLYYVLDVQALEFVNA